MALDKSAKRYRSPFTGKLEPAAHAEAVAALRAERRAPTAADAPPLSVFPGPKPKVLPGQLSITVSPEAS